MANSHESRNDDEPMPHKGSERLAATKQNADYWFEAGKKENNIEAVAQCLMQSINAWKNAAYTLAEELADARSETKPRWIPVAERQPPCANNYLATLTYPDGEKHVQERYFSMRGTWNSDYVSHWQPLPEAAK